MLGVGKLNTFLVCSNWWRTSPTSSIPFKPCLKCWSFCYYGSWVMLGAIKCLLSRWGAGLDTRVSSPGREKDQRYVCKFPPSPPFFLLALPIARTHQLLSWIKVQILVIIFKQDNQRTAVERNNVNGIKLCLCTGENMVNIDISRVVG